MLGTISLIALAVTGFYQILPWVVLPIASIANTFIGMHFPPGRAEGLLEDGKYMLVYFSMLPVQAVFAAIVYGLGYGVGLLVN